MASTLSSTIKLVTDMQNNSVISNEAQKNQDIRRFHRWNHTATEMCIPLAIHQFPKDLVGKETREDGGVLIHVFAAFYIFGCLAYLCDTYFVPALEVLTENLNIQPEVAGATFMAIGSSSPELFTSIVGVYVAKDDVGVGTIIGSAVFNILFVIGCCIIASPSSINIEIYPIARDAAFYTLGLIPLAAICMDGKVDWYDAVSLVGLYGVYIIMMYKSVKLEKGFYKLFPMARSEDKTIIETTPILDHGGNHGIDAAQQKAEEAFSLGINSNGQASKENGFVTYINSGNEIRLAVVSSSQSKSPWLSDIYPPVGKFKRALWLLGLPIIILFWLTIPNVQNTRWRKWFTLTFLCSLAYIGALSYMLVYMVTIIGYTIGVPDIVMGLVLIASGASVPDALASIIVARHGKGRMSISNCIGSNIFDILLGLGLPWLMKTLITDHGEAVPIMSGSIKFTVFILMGSVVAMLFVFWISRWKLKWPAGLMLIILYIGFITVSCLFEMNVFGQYNLPQCE